MKRIMQTGVMAALIISSATMAMEEGGNNAPAPSVFDRLNSMYGNAKDKVSYYAVQGYVNEKMKNAHKKIAPYMGKTKVDTFARVAFLGCGLFLLGKQLSQNFDGFNKLILGSLGFMCAKLGINQCVINGVDIADYLRKKHQDLSGEMNKALDKLNADQFAPEEEVDIVS